EGGISAWQNFLVFHGYNLVVDGIFGPRTREATIAWQETAGIPATGEFDEATFASMAIAPEPTVKEPAATTPPGPTVPPARTPEPGPAFWIDVKYRDDAVNVAAPYFAPLGRSDATVEAAWYDSGNEYMVIVLGGTAYQYCSIPSSQWSGLRRANDLDGLYEASIRGNYDCRIFPVPSYSN
ncbi:MAG: peptidoglycan-binding protein, partial [Acidimicrobiales bacterium]